VGLARKGSVGYVSKGYKTRHDGLLPYFNLPLVSFSSETPRRNPAGAIHRSNAALLHNHSASRLQCRSRRRQSFPPLDSLFPRMLWWFVGPR